MKAGPRGLSASRRTFVTSWVRDETGCAPSLIAAVTPVGFWPILAVH